MRTSLPLVLVLLLAACDGQLVAPVPPAPLVGPGGPGTVPGDPAAPGPAPTEPPVVTLPAAVACNGTTVGRSYRGFNNEALDADRADLAAGQDLRRLRDGSDLRHHYESRGIDPPEVARTLTQSFGSAPEHWFELSEANFATAYATYALAFAGCLTKVKDPRNYHPFGHADFRATPTAASAAHQCQVMGNLIWKRAMAADELALCVEHALEVPALEADVQRQWAYVCAAVAGAADFISY